MEAKEGQGKVRGVVRWAVLAVAVSLSCMILSPSAFAASGGSPARKPLKATSRLAEPQLHIVPSGKRPEVALTLDACMGGVDYRILDLLVSRRIPATIFATSRWINHNPQAMAALKANSDLFEIEDHGAEHIPAVLGYAAVFGIQPAGTLEAVFAEIDGGAETILHETGRQPIWYRDATALYTPSVIEDINHHGYKVAGFSLNGDVGASLPAETVFRRISAARSGDVIISHINQPNRPSGAGVAKGIAYLLDHGFHFVKLSEDRTIPVASAEGLKSKASSP